MKSYVKLPVVICLLLLANAFSALAASYYFCDFEDAAENQLWKLNTPKNENHQWQDLWYIGNAIACDGQQSMYISTDGGATAGYTRASCLMIAWREFTDLEPGTYDLAFDWCNVGDSARAGIYVAWVPEAQWSKMVCGMNDDMTTRDWITDNLLTIEGRQVLYNSSVWSHGVTKLTVDGTPHRLLFVFRQSGNATVRNPGASIDNVQIARNNCGTPTNLSVKTSGQYVTLSWQSTGERFNIRYAKHGATDVKTIEGLTSPSLMLSLEHGVYDFYIQVICAGEQSVWYAFPVVLVYDSKCFNYLDLSDDQCFYAGETADDWHKNDDNLLPGKIDNGFLSMYSRHTIHYQEGEYDAQTYNSFDSDGNPVAPLRTIPEGEIASVRIGSWEKSAHVARIVYDFTVDTVEAAVLMLKYALVLQSSGHEEPARPRFTLDVQDYDTGESLSRCTTVDFSSKTSGDGWYRSPEKSFNETSDGDVCWRDWTMVGLNLSEFDGAHIRIVLTAYGCTASIHYGYAYFTLNCTSGRIEGINCGDIPTEEFIAPDGFNYRWYLASDPAKTLSAERVFPVKYDDDRRYKVDVIYKTDNQCGFTLNACAIPRYPVPEATYRVYQKQCKNYIQFTNNSHVRTKNLRTNEVIEYSEYPIESIVWDFGSLQATTAEWSPEFEAPAEGGTFEVSLKAGIGLCDSTQYMTIVVPPVSPDSIVEKYDLCKGQSYTHNGRPYTSDTTLVYRGQSVFGCDSIHTLQLHFYDTLYTDVYDTILHGEVYEFQGQSYTASGDYPSYFLSGMGCDSVVTLHLYVRPLLKVMLASVEEPCAGSTSLDIVYTVLEGEPDSCYVLFESDAWRDSALVLTDTLIMIDVPADIRPGWYPLVLRFSSSENGECLVQTECVVRYPASIIQQRWDDVLGILNAEHNGGYDFGAYQWYKDGVPVMGATSPYYYEADKLDMSSEYTVELVRTGEERGLLSCPYQVVTWSDASTQPVTRKYLRNGVLYIQIENTTYNIVGQPVVLIGK